MTNHTTPARRTRMPLTVTALLLAAGTLTPIPAVAGPVEDLEHDCLSEAAGTADSRERWADRCRSAAEELRSAYHDCMHDAPGTADSHERWVDHCAATASATVTAD